MQKYFGKVKANLRRSLTARTPTRTLTRFLSLAQETMSKSKSTSKCIEQPHRNTTIRFTMRTLSAST